MPSKFHICKASSLLHLIETTAADELIANVRIFDPGSSLRALEVLADARQQLAANAKGTSDAQ